MPGKFTPPALFFFALSPPPEHTRPPDEVVFYKTIMSDPKRFIPVLYDPVVADACLEFGHIYRRPRGMYITHHMQRNGRGHRLDSHYASSGAMLNIPWGPEAGIKHLTRYPACASLRDLPLFDRQNSARACCPLFF